MQRPNPETVTLNDILITQELSRRAPRSPNWQAEAEAMRSLGRQMAQASESLMQTLADTALELCQAGTAGVSLLETTPDGEEIFRRNVLAGTLAHHVGGSTERNFSPYGVCLEQGSPVLFSHPEYYFTYFQAVNTPIVEGLVLPLIADNHALGTIWIMLHDEQRHFDSEDVRVMTSLADFTATALLLQQRQTGELLAVNATLETEIAERRQTDEQTHALISNLPGGAAFVVDRDLRYLLAEGEALAIAGFKPEDLVGKTIFEVLPPELATYYEPMYRQAFAGEPFEHEHNAHNHTYISRGTPLRAENGEIYAVLAVSYDITERKRVEDERKQAEAAIAADLQDTQLLHNLATRLTTEGDIETLYQEIIAAAIALTRANAGSIQILDEATQELVLIATQGSTPEMIEHFHRVNASSNTSCGRALVTGDRTFVDFDVPESEDPDGSMRMHIEAGYLSAQSTPLITRSGRAIGMVSTHWSNHYRPTERELRFLDLLARQAADLIEQRQAEAALRENEEKFRTLADTAPALIWYNDAQGENRFINQHFLDFTGRSAEQIRGEGWHELVHPDEAEEYIADYLAAVREQRPWHNRNRIRRHDGVWRWHDNYAQPLFNADGVYLGHVGVTIDNTDVIEAESALRESEVKYRSLFDSIDEGVCLIERLPLRPDGLRDYRYIAMNPAMQAMFGIPDLSGQSIRDNFPNEIEDWYDDYDRVLETGQPIRFERETEPQGMVLEMFVTRVEDGSGKRLIAVMKDVTERKRTEERQAFLLKFSDALRAEPDADSIASRAVWMLAEHLRLDRFWLSEVFEQQDISTVGPEYHRPDLPPMSGVYRLSDYPETMRQLVTQPMVIHDVANDPGFSDSEKALLAQFHLRALLVVPLREGQHQVIWALAAAMATPRHWNESERVLLEQAGERVWAAIERARAEEALRESEAQYRALFTTMAQGFCLIEKIETLEGQPSDFRYLTVNPAFERHTGMHNVVGRTIRECVPDAEQHIMDLYDEVVRTGQPQQFEDYVSALDLWMAANVFPAQQPGQIAVLFSNISERKRTEIQLRRTAEMDAFRVKLSDALRSLADPVQIQAEACRLLGEQLGADRAYYVEVHEAEGYARVNQHYSRGDSPSIIGNYPLSEYGWSLPIMRRGETIVITDTQSSNIIPDAERAAMAMIGMIGFVALPLIKGEVLVGALAVNEPAPREWTEAEVELVRETGERIWADIQRARAEAALRESELQRVREQSAREQERQRAESLAELDRAKTLFFSNVSHEFRTPLTLSLAPLQDALSDRTHPLDPVHRERLELVHRNSLRLLKLVNTLLDFSRIEAGRMEAVYEPTDLATFTTELSSVFRSAIKRAGLQLNVDCPSLPEPVFVDREMWEKIVLNLLSNAFKFTFEGEIRVSLHVTDRHQAVLQIQDTGTGIAPEHLPHLFERFYQVRNTQARTHQGSGIGLALVHELLRLHGGTIEVSSTVGEGTCFSITLPFGTDHLPSDHLQDEGDRHPVRTLASTAMGATAYVEEAERWLPEENGEEAVIPAPYSLLPTPPSARVLVVDDNADMREYLTRILSEHVKVIAVADGVTALAVAQERVPDLILSDVMMPGLDGFELLEALRADSRTREIPIILLSARAGEESIVEGLEAGADDYLIKPFSAQELVSRVNAHLQTAQLRGEALQQERIINRQKDESIRQKDEFISVVSHELNTPLVSILGWARMLRSSPPNPAMLSKALDTIERNATLQGKLVQDLLDLSRISAGKLRLNPQPIELKPVIETAIATVTQPAIDKSIHLTWQENVTEPVVVMGDGDRLSQVFINLLTNAIKFTPESGSVTLELSVMNNDGSADASYAEIRVTDTGIGIAADFLPHVFERFRQAEGAHSVKGLGLGLAITRHIVELHNGTVHAESAGEGLGATFTVRLPLLQDGES